METSYYQVKGIQIWELLLGLQGVHENLQNLKPCQSTEKLKNTHMHAHGQKKSYPQTCHDENIEIMRRVWWSSGGCMYVCCFQRGFFFYLQLLIRKNINQLSFCHVGHSVWNQHGKWIYTRLRFLSNFIYTCYGLRYETTTIYLLFGATIVFRGTRMTFLGGGLYGNVRGLGVQNVLQQHSTTTTNSIPSACFFPYFSDWEGLLSACTSICDTTCSEINV